MSDSVVTDVYLDFDVEQIELDMDEGLKAAEKEAADKLVADAKRRFKSKTKNMGSGEMGGHFFDIESKFEKGGYIAGVFGDSVGRGSKAWLESLGARAHFFEYGRSQPGHGKGNGGPQPVWIRKLLGQAPRPFIRPAMHKVKREYNGITKKEIKAAVKKANKLSTVDAQITKAVNKIS